MRRPFPREGDAGLFYPTDPNDEVFAIPLGATRGFETFGAQLDTLKRRLFDASCIPELGNPGSPKEKP